MRNPLSPWTFLLRNRGQTVPLVGVIVLAIMLVMGIVAIMDSIPLSIRSTYDYSQAFVAVTPRGDPSRTPQIVAKIERESPVPIERMLTCRAVIAQVNSIVGKWDFAVVGLRPEDTEYYLDKMLVTDLEGRLPMEAKPECVISEPVARNLDLSLGSTLLKPDDQDMYSPYPVKVVGIAKTPKWFMLADFEYLNANHFPPVSNVLAFAKDPGSQEALGDWAKKAFKGERAFVFTFKGLEEQTNHMFRILYSILNVVIATLVVVITLMMGMLMNIYQSQRLTEFGLLQALGFTKRQLARRVIVETFIVVAFGWLVGVALAIGLLNVAKVAMFDPNAFALQQLDPNAVLYTLPAPFAIAIVAVATIMVRFRRFDPVGVIERRPV